MGRAIIGRTKEQPMPSSTRYPRHGENGGFDRVVYFTDAVFAIAMTLLVVEIGVPETIEGAAEDPAAMLGALGDKGPLIFAFFLGCYVIGSYWAAHHRFMTWLAAVDRGFVALTVVYLSFVALLPFPTGVLGEFGDNPISVVAFAVNMGRSAPWRRSCSATPGAGACSGRSCPRRSTGGRCGRRCCRCCCSRSRCRWLLFGPGWRSSSGSWLSRSSCS
jgi:hypothetical protein